MVVPLEHSIKRTVGPSVEPITLAEAKAHIGLPDSTTGHNSLLNVYIQAARETVERDTRRALVKQTWVKKLDAFPSVNYIELPKPPLLGVTSLTYTATTGNTVTWSTSNYEVDTNRTPGVLWQKYDVDWPTGVRDIQNAVTITLTAGYSTDSGSVPEQAKTAVKMLVNDWFCNRSIDGPSNREAYLSLIHSLRWGDYK